MGDKANKSLEALWRFDAEIRARGFARLAGVDEAGRGCLAGPVVAAAAILPADGAIDGLNDSKQLRPETREALFDLVRERALAFGVGIVEADVIDRINILQATLQAAGEALAQLAPPPDYVLTDFLKIKGLPQPVEAITKGDARSASIAAASVLAKVTRDRLMLEYDREYPGYGFAAHKGYGTAAHLAALRERGPTTLHRLTFNGVCFFETECRRSRTCERLAARIEAAKIDATNPGDAVNSVAVAGNLRREIEDARPPLPQVEREFLLQLDPSLNGEK
jgi:ribonuclease HII